MFKLQTNDILSFPFEEYAECVTAQQLQTMAETHRLSNYNRWMLPQILAYYGRWQLHMTAQGQVDSKATAQQNIQQPWEIGLWRVVTQLKRSSLVATQNRPDSARYSMLTPLILAGVKQSQGVRYQQWFNAEHLVHPQLWEAMHWAPPTMSTEELLDCRERGLEIPKQGRQLNPTNRWCLSHQQGTPLEHAPALAGTMLTQIWCAHPTLRHELMVLDPEDWDRMPPALLESEVLQPTGSRRGASTTTIPTKLPWLD